jgi:hypothetical protein
MRPVLSLASLAMVASVSNADLEGRGVGTHPPADWPDRGCGVVVDVDAGLIYARAEPAEPLHWRETERELKREIVRVVKQDHLDNPPPDRELLRENFEILATVVWHDGSVELVVFQPLIVH